MRDESDEVTAKEGALKGAPVLSPLKIPGPPAPVGVREKRIPQPDPIEAIVGLPEPVVPQQLADLVSTFIEGIGETPGRAIFKEEDFAFLRKEVGLVRFKVAKGVARQSVEMQSAEEAVARALTQETAVNLKRVEGHQGLPANRSPGFPYGIFLLPMFFEIMKLIDLRGGFLPGSLISEPAQRRVIQPGEGGKHEPSRTQRAADKLIPRKPIPTGAGGARGGTRNVNAANLLQGQILKARRKLSPRPGPPAQNISGPKQKGSEL